MSMNETEVKMAEGLEYWTADEVAECLSYPDPDQVIYKKLWQFLSDAENQTPAGGDGSNGTVETPDARLDLDNDDKAGSWWHKLTNAEQLVINEAWAKDYE